MTRSPASVPPPDPSCGARYFTPRTPSRRTYGPEVSKVAAILGTPLMPWQNMVVDTALEVDPATGKLAYRFVIVKVPRQAGKTTLTLAVCVHRAIAFANITGRPQNIIYTAQTAQDAAKKWSDQSNELVQAIGERRVHKRGGNNRPTLAFANGSEYRPISVTKKSGPSQSNDLLLYDEAWAHEDGRIEAGLGPTTIARDQPQSWMYSNAGTRESSWWKGKWTMGRRLAAEGNTGDGICYFEWSCDRDDPDYDPSDTAYIARHHPAAGITIDLAGFRAEYLSMLANPEEGLEGYERAYANVEPDETVRNWEVVDEPAWAATGTDDVIAGPRTFALDVTNDRAWATIGWAGHTGDGLELPEIIAHERGTSWVIPFLDAKHAAHPRYERKVYIPAGGEAARMQPDLERANYQVIPIPKAEYATAAAQLYDQLELKDAGTVRHRASGQKPLDDAMAGAAWTTTGELRVWDRRKSSTVISPLVVFTIARYAHSLEADARVDLLSTIA